MISLISILGFVILSSFLGLIGGFLLLWNKKLAYKISLYLVSFAVGALLGVSFLDLLPESFKSGNEEVLFLSTLIGILSFFFIENFLIWHHHHLSKSEFHSFNYLILFGDSIHNFIDGVLLALAFSTSFPLGITSFLAVVFHEIPQEIGDFSILLYGKMKRGKIILYNITTALTSVIGALVAYFYLSGVQNLIGIVLAFIAGSFIYISTSDLIPETRKEIKKGRVTFQIILIILGIFVIWLVGKFLKH